MKKFLEYYLFAGVAYAAYKAFGPTKLPVSSAAPLVVTWPLALGNQMGLVPSPFLGGLGARRMPAPRKQNHLKPYVSPYTPY